MLIALPTAMAQMPGAPQAKHFPWSDASLSPDQHADPVIKEMTLDENISLLHGQDMPLFSKGPTDSNGGAGYTATIPRLGIPSIQMANSAYGVTRGAAMGKVFVGAAQRSYRGVFLGSKGRIRVGRAHRPRTARTGLQHVIERWSEPRTGASRWPHPRIPGRRPVSGRHHGGQPGQGVQSQDVIGDLKHYAMNDQESGRNAVNVNSI
ncbi:MAG: hypothetical protein ACYCPM_03095 [Acidobacteriaceae bacterium]